jgi:hypothetical protein
MQTFYHKKSLMDFQTTPWHLPDKSLTTRPDFNEKCRHGLDIRPFLYPRHLADNFDRPLNLLQTSCSQLGSVFKAATDILQPTGIGLQSYYRHLAANWDRSSKLLQTSCRQLWSAFKILQKGIRTCQIFPWIQIWHLRCLIWHGCCKKREILEKSRRFSKITPHQKWCKNHQNVRIFSLIPNLAFPLPNLALLLQKTQKCGQKVEHCIETSCTLTYEGECVTVDIYV